MPATISRKPSEDDSDPRKIQFGAILEKIRRGGSPALTDTEKLIVQEIFRTAGMTMDIRARKLRDEICHAHLEYCFRLPSKPT
jgi:hypothetical protein